MVDHDPFRTAAEALLTNEAGMRPCPEHRCASAILNAAQVNYDEFRRETLRALEHVKTQMATQPGGRKDVNPLNRPSASRH